MITKDNKDLPIIGITPENYLVPKGEERFYHVKMEVRSFDQHTGERLSHPFIQKFARIDFEEGMMSVLRQQGYDMVILHDPKEWLKNHAEEMAKNRAQKAAEAKAKAEAEKEALKEQIRQELLAETEAEKEALKEQIRQELLAEAKAETKKTGKKTTKKEDEASAEAEVSAETEGLDLS